MEKTKYLNLQYLLEKLPESDTLLLNRLSHQDVLHLSKVNSQFQDLISKYCKRIGRIFVLLDISDYRKSKKALSMPRRVGKHLLNAAEVGKQWRVTKVTCCYCDTVQWPWKEEVKPPEALVTLKLKEHGHKCFSKL